VQDRIWVRVCPAPPPFLPDDRILFDLQEHEAVRNGFPSFFAQFAEHAQGPGTVFLTTQVFSTLSLIFYPENVVGSRSLQKIESIPPE
jgi:hypothetical protein